MSEVARLERLPCLHVRDVTAEMVLQLRTPVVGRMVYKNVAAVERRGNAELCTNIPLPSAPTPHLPPLPTTKKANLHQ